MTPLEAATLMLELGPECNDSGFCSFCNESPRRKGHASDCPWLLMPKIVAALEAAARLRVAVSAALPFIESYVQTDPFMNHVYDDLSAALRDSATTA